jgi:hypothetical protein
MKLPPLAALGVLAGALAVASVVLVGQSPDARYSLAAPTGIGFSEFEGYESWQVIGASQPDNAGGCGTSPEPGCIKALLGNPEMIDAYEAGFPANGKPVPDGAKMAKVEWKKRHSDGPPVSAYPVTLPGALVEVSFMMKDSRRFPATDGWGYATFKHDTVSGAWKSYGEGPAYANTCHACHTVVKPSDFVFSRYAKR